MLTERVPLRSRAHGNKAETQIKRFIIHKNPKIEFQLSFLGKVKCLVLDEELLSDGAQVHLPELSFKRHQVPHLQRQSEKLRPEHLDD